jgi:hypothetical protein
MVLVAEEGTKELEDSQRNNKAKPPHMQIK